VPKLTRNSKIALYKKWIGLNKPDIKKYAEAEDVSYPTMRNIIEIGQTKDRTREGKNS